MSEDIEPSVGSEATSGIGGRLRQFREALALTQAQMADSIGGKMRGVQNNELGLTLPNSKMLIGLCSLGMNANWLLTGEGPMMLGDLKGKDECTQVNPATLSSAIADVETIATMKKLSLSPERRGQLGALMYQYITSHQEGNAASRAYLSLLVDLMAPAQPD